MVNEVVSNAAVLKLAGMVVTETNKTAKAGLNASVAFGATLLADEMLNGNSPLGKRAILKSIKQSMANRGEGAGSYNTYSRIGSQLLALYRAEMMGAVLALQGNGRNSPLQATEIFTAVKDALALVPGLLGSFTELKAATIGGVPQSDDEKAAAKVRALVNAVNKSEDANVLDFIARIASRRAVVQRGTVTLGGPGDVTASDLERAMTEADALAKELLAMFSPGEAPAAELEVEEEAA